MIWREYQWRNLKGLSKCVDLVWSVGVGGGDRLKIVLY